MSASRTFSRRIGWGASGLVMTTAQTVMVGPASVGTPGADSGHLRL
ncbi:hypothetical protein [Nocardia sp. NPDC004711]